MPRENTVVMEGVRIIYRNFEGKEGQYNRAGDRNFSVVLDPDTAKAMLEDGWNVKTRPPREEGDEELHTLAVSVSFNPRARPPRIVVVTSRGRTQLDEDTCSMLDWADIQNVDLIVRPYEWTVRGETGIKAYLQSMYVTIEEDPLERKYAMMDEERDRDGDN